MCALRVVLHRPVLCGADGVGIEDGNGQAHAPHRRGAPVHRLFVVERTFPFEQGLRLAVDGAVGHRSACTGGGDDVAGRGCRVVFGDGVGIVHGGDGAGIAGHGHLHHGVLGRAAVGQGVGEGLRCASASGQRIERAVGIVGHRTVGQQRDQRAGGKRHRVRSGGARIGVHRRSLDVGDDQRRGGRVHVGIVVDGHDGDGGVLIGHRHVVGRPGRIVDRNHVDEGAPDGRIVVPVVHLRFHHPLGGVGGIGRVVEGDLLQRTLVVDRRGGADKRYRGHAGHDARRVGDAVDRTGGGLDAVRLRPDHGRVHQQAVVRLRIGEAHHAGFQHRVVEVGDLHHVGDGDGRAVLGEGGGVVARGQAGDVVVVQIERGRIVDRQHMHQGACGGRERRVARVAQRDVDGAVRGIRVLGREGGCLEGDGLQRRLPLRVGGGGGGGERDRERTVGGKHGVARGAHARRGQCRRGKVQRVARLAHEHDHGLHHVAFGIAHRHIGVDDTHRPHVLGVGVLEARAGCGAVVVEGGRVVHAGDGQGDRAEIRSALAVGDLVLERVHRAGAGVEVLEGAVGVVGVGTVGTQRDGGAGGQRDRCRAAGRDGRGRRSRRRIGVDDLGRCQRIAVGVDVVGEQARGRRRGEGRVLVGGRPVEDRALATWNELQRAAVHGVARQSGGLEPQLEGVAVLHVDGDVQVLRAAAVGAAVHRSGEGGEGAIGAHVDGGARRTLVARHRVGGEGELLVVARLAHIAVDARHAEDAGEVGGRGGAGDEVFHLQRNRGAGGGADVVEDGKARRRAAHIHGQARIGRVENGDAHVERLAVHRPHRRIDDAVAHRATGHGRACDGGIVGQRELARCEHGAVGRDGGRVVEARVPVVQIGRQRRAARCIEIGVGQVGRWWRQRVVDTLVDHEAVPGIAVDGGLEDVEETVAIGIVGRRGSSRRRGDAKAVLGQIRVPVAVGIGVEVVGCRVGRDAKAGRVGGIGVDGRQALAGQMGGCLITGAETGARVVGIVQSVRVHVGNAGARTGGCHVAAGGLGLDVVGDAVVVGVDVEVVGHAVAVRVAAQGDDQVGQRLRRLGREEASPVAEQGLERSRRRAAGIVDAVLRVGGRIVGRPLRVEAVAARDGRDARRLVRIAVVGGRQAYRARGARHLHVLVGHPAIGPREGVQVVVEADALHQHARLGGLERQGDARLVAAGMAEDQPVLPRRQGGAGKGRRQRQVEARYSRHVGDRDRVAAVQRRQLRRGEDAVEMERHVAAALGAVEDAVVVVVHVEDVVDAIGVAVEALAVGDLRIARKLVGQLGGGVVHRAVAVAIDLAGTARCQTALGAVRLAVVVGVGVAEVEDRVAVGGICVDGGEQAHVVDAEVRGVVRVGERLIAYRGLCLDLVGDEVGIGVEVQHVGQAVAVRVHGDHFGTVVHRLRKAIAVGIVGGGALHVVAHAVVVGVRDRPVLPALDEVRDAVIVGVEVQMVGHAVAVGVAWGSKGQGQFPPVAPAAFDADAGQVEGEAGVGAHHPHAAGGGVARLVRPGLGGRLVPDHRLVRPSLDGRRRHVELGDPVGVGQVHQGRARRGHGQAGRVGLHHFVACNVRVGIEAAAAAQPVQMKDRVGDRLVEGDGDGARCRIRRGAGLRRRAGGFRRGIPQIDERQRRRTLQGGGGPHVDIGIEGVVARDRERPSRRRGDVHRRADAVHHRGRAVGGGGPHAGGASRIALVHVEDAVVVVVDVVDIGDPVTVVVGRHRRGEDACREGRRRRGCLPAGIVQHGGGRVRRDARRHVPDPERDVGRTRKAVRVRHEAQERVRVHQQHLPLGDGGGVVVCGVVQFEVGPVVAGDVGAKVLPAALALVGGHDADTEGLLLDVAHLHLRQQIGDRDGGRRGPGGDGEGHHRLARRRHRSVAVGPQDRDGTVVLGLDDQRHFQRRRLRPPRSRIAAVRHGEGQAVVAVPVGDVVIDEGAGSRERGVDVRRRPGQHQGVGPGADDRRSRNTAGNRTVHRHGAVGDLDGERQIAPAVVHVGNGDAVEGEATVLPRHVAHRHGGRGAGPERGVGPLDALQHQSEGCVGGNFVEAAAHGHVGVGIAGGADGVPRGLDRLAVEPDARRGVGGHGQDRGGGLRGVAGEAIGFLEVLRGAHDGHGRIAVRPARRAVALHHLDDVDDVARPDGVPLAGRRWIGGRGDVDDVELAGVEDAYARSVDEDLGAVGAGEDDIARGDGGGRDDHLLRPAFHGQQLLGQVVGAPVGEEGGGRVVGEHRHRTIRRYARAGEACLLVDVDVAFVEHHLEGRAAAGWRDDDARRVLGGDNGHAAREAGQHGGDVFAAQGSHGQDQGLVPRGSRHGANGERHVGGGRQAKGAVHRHGSRRDRQIARRCRQLRPVDGGQTRGSDGHLHRSARNAGAGHGDDGPDIAGHGEAHLVQRSPCPLEGQEEVVARRLARCQIRHGEDRCVVDRHHVDRRGAADAGAGLRFQRDRGGAQSRGRILGRVGVAQRTQRRLQIAVGQRAARRRGDTHGGAVGTVGRDVDGKPLRDAGHDQIGRQGCRIEAKDGGPEDDGLLLPVRQIGERHRQRGEAAAIG